MLNQVVLVGRIADDPTIKEFEDGKKEAIVVLGVQRTFKNDEGIYDTDFIRCILFNGIASSTCEYCHKGDLVGIKGRIQVNRSKDKKGKEIFSTEVIAEKVTFLSNKAE